MQTQNYKYIYTCMHVCTHICIITYICSSGFPAKLLPCVVHYPRAPSRKAETHLWGQGILKPISPGPEVHKVHRSCCPQPKHRQIQQHRAPQNQQGHFCHPWGCSVSANSCLGDAEMHLSEQKDLLPFQAHRIWVVSVFHHWVFQWKSYFVCK